MTIIARLSSFQGERSQNPNKALAGEILITQDQEAIKELKRLLINPPNDDILFDALKVLEMIGESNPKMINPLIDALIPLLGHEKNKITWMCMSALSTITIFHPEKTYSHLSHILRIMDEGSVITRDKGFVILMGLYSDPRYQSEMKALVTEQLLTAPDNQFGQYVEKWMKIIQPEHRSGLESIMAQRIPELTHPSHQKRASKNLRKLQKP